MTKEKGIFTKIKATSAYDPETSLSLATACELAYEKEVTIEETTRTWGFSRTIFVNVQKSIDIDTQAYVMSNDTDIVVVFRGSGTVEDWLTNFQAVSDPGPMDNTKAHEGFQDALYPAVIRLTDIIIKRRNKEQRVWLTGHSLGGALASLFSGMLVENNLPIFGLYTFASPRAGDYHFAKLLNEALSKGPHYRVVNEDDIVPHLPPEPFYSHSGNRIILKQNKREDSQDEWTAIRKKVFGWFMDIADIFEAKIDIYGNHVLHNRERGYLVRLKEDLERSR